MYKIQTFNAIAASGLNQFPRELYEVASEIQHPDAILVRSHDLHHHHFPSSVKVVGRAGAGVNNIPVAKLTELGIPVLNTPGANANAVRELVIAGLLLASRNIYPAWRYMHDLKSNEDIDKRIEQDKKQFIGTELLGKTLGVIGLGNIGVKVANAAIHLGMRVIGYDPEITVNKAWELSSEVEQSLSLDDLLIASDFITIHVPLTAETKNSIDSTRLHLMKNNVVLLNFSREGIIDTQALLTALSEKKVFAYVTDFPTPGLKDHPKVISLPHLGASTKEAEENCAVMIVKEIRHFLEKGSISHSVNFPSLDMPQSKANNRLAIVNKNVPNMVAQISAKLAKAGLNIVSLLNKSRDEIAYTMIDLATQVDEHVIKQIEQIEGVVQVRVIKSP